MKNFTIFYLSIFVLMFFSFSGSAQKKNKEILEDYFSRPTIDTVYESTDDFPPLEVGQWVLLRKYEGSKEQQVLLKYSVVGKKDDKFWIEVKDLRKKKTIIVKFLVEGIEGNSFAKYKAVDGYYKQNDDPVSKMWGFFTMYLYPLSEKEKSEKLNATSTIAAGTFNNVWGHSGSFSQEFSMEGPGISIDMKSFQSGIMLYHTAVPFGLLGWKATKDRAEVIDFGFSGAKSEIEEN